MAKSRYYIYKDQLIALYEKYDGKLSISAMSRMIIKDNNLDASIHGIRKVFKDIIDEYNKPEEEKVKDGYIENILVIGDIHEPFCKDGYLEFCQDTYKKFKCNKVIFIGDIIDNHYSSYHETDADGLGGKDELELAIYKISKWYKAFPEADVIIGNHDRMVMRKAQTSSIPTAWIREYKDVLNTPNWNFVESVKYNDVLYVHGEAGTARTRIKADMQSVVQGHLHTQAYCEWLVGAQFRVFGLQTGCGIDHKSYAMAYAKHGKKPAVGCAVILNNGKQPINVLMEL